MSKPKTIRPIKSASAKIRIPAAEDVNAEERARQLAMADRFRGYAYEPGLKYARYALLACAAVIEHAVKCATEQKAPRKRAERVRAR